MPAVSIVVRGKVQGVYFRKFTQQKALQLNLNGFVMNKKDGSVYIEAEGSDETLNEFTSWCRKGAGAARVDHIEVKTITGSYTGFEIRH